MSTTSQQLPLKQAVLRAADAIEAMQEIPSVAELAEAAGVTRQYLHRLAKREIERRAKEKGRSQQDPAPDDHEDRRVPDADDTSPEAGGIGTSEEG